MKYTMDTVSHQVIFDMQKSQATQVRDKALQSHLKYRKHGKIKLGIELVRWTMLYYLGMLYLKMCDSLSPFIE